VRADYQSTPACRNSLYVTANSRNYMDTEFPAVAQFRSEIRRAFPDREDKLSMWELEGWESAQWLTDAMTSCAAQLTRACVEDFMNRPGGYDGHGLTTGAGFQVNVHPGSPTHNCLNVARWQDSAYGGRGGWVTTTPGKQFVCYDVPVVPYTA